LEAHLRPFVIVVRLMLPRYFGFGVPFAKRF